MAGTIVEPSDSRADPAPKPARRGRALAIIAALVVAALAVAAASAYRTAVRTERAETFRSLYQAQGMKLGDQLALQSQLPAAERSTTAVADALRLRAPGTGRMSLLEFGVGSSDLSGDRLWAVLDGASFVAGDPWWVGDTNQRLSVLVFYRATTVDDSTAIETGSCVVEAVGVDWAGIPCTPEQLREFRLL